VVTESGSLCTTCTLSESLYQIDPATYQAAWNSAKGDEAKAEAAAAIAHLTVITNPPVDGRGHLGVSQIDTGVFDRGLSRHDIGIGSNRPSYLPGGLEQRQRRRGKSRSRSGYRPSDGETCDTEGRRSPWEFSGDGKRFAVHYMYANLRRLRLCLLVA
jgi:hypothetical protein